MNPDVLLIGMVSYIPGIPASLGEPTGALPSLVYIWENASERAFANQPDGLGIVLAGPLLRAHLHDALVLARRRLLK